MTSSAFMPREPGYAEWRATCSDRVLPCANKQGFTAEVPKNAREELQEGLDTDCKTIRKHGGRSPGHALCDFVFWKGKNAHLLADNESRDEKPVAHIDTRCGKNHLRSMHVVTDTIVFMVEQIIQHSIF